MKIGKAKYGFSKKTYFKIKDGDNVYRILPPLGELYDKGTWSVFYKVHYGYKNSAGKLRPFHSPLVKNNKTKMIEVPDAAQERIDKLKAQLELAKKNGDTKLVAKLNEFVGQKGSFNCDNNHYVNAIDLQGNIGILKIRHRAKTALDATIKKLRESGVDPLSAENGRFFVINRSGTGLDTTFQVSVYKEKIKVEGIGVVEKDVVHVLDEAIISQLSDKAGNLEKLFPRPTSEQVARIVAEGAPAVDEIFDAKAVSATTEEDYDDSSEYEDTSSATTTPTASAAKAQQIVETTATTVEKAVAAVKEAPVSAPTTTASQISEMSEEDFLKSLNL